LLLPLRLHDTYARWVSWNARVRFLLHYLIRFWFSELAAADYCCYGNGRLQYSKYSKFKHMHWNLCNRLSFSFFRPNHCFPGFKVDCYFFYFFFLFIYLFFLTKCNLHSWTTIQMSNTIKKHVQRNMAPHTKLQVPKGEEQ
jgi:hypothetical protein